ncbi:cyclopropane-fatty-acyl-phospholipid synthase family protein [Acuticoccus sp. I52.16.1]|uniref:SAM-dependent methyltransferase n=1 Tax=Acuticoccus sp. I52.16.1 TaxID=2928472 RepID=UPI001FD16819|nr:cyclopropane-fatty-acyl-phospholipid synthase family protein [Acuticoccus sp. I52.16.1]UOM33875.1 cyclopropane-fatty-acyl-phospholipid synthase family protein [Acuticoccus sp. I52.16.1]
MNPILHRILRTIVRHGQFAIIDAAGDRHTFGDGTGPAHTIRFHEASAARALVGNPELTLGESYMNGLWSVEEGDLTSLLVMLMKNHHAAGSSAVQRGLRMLLRRFQQHNTARAARRNAQSHYDVGNDIYRLFLDEDWQYSCAYFPHFDMTLEDAQRAKKRHIAAKMLLEPGQTVLDIGCGWGGMGLYLAQQTGAHVTGITLADNQVTYANERAAGEPNATFRVQDYRAVEESFDRIVSVGMFEHVGVGYYDEYFQTAARILKDDGVMLLHSIGRTDGPGTTNPFIARYIFPGGYIPSLSEVLPAVERAGLIVTDVEILRLHYAETIKHWRARFLAHWDKVVELRSETFARMWDFYLAGSEAAFRTGDMMVFQMQLAKRIDKVPLTRDYITSAERSLANRDSGRPAPPPALVARHG